MSNFTLEPVSPGMWTGPAGSTVVVSVTSDNSNATTMHDAAYPDGAPLAVAGGKSTLTIENDHKNHVLAVGITPPAVPDNWQIVEVGKDGTTQTLLPLIAGKQVGAIIIVPK